MYIGHSGDGAVNKLKVITCVGVRHGHSHTFFFEVLVLWCCKISLECFVVLCDSKGQSLLPFMFMLNHAWIGLLYNHIHSDLNICNICMNSFLMQSIPQDRLYQYAFESLMIFVCSYNFPSNSVICVKHSLLTKTYKRMLYCEKRRVRVAIRHYQTLARVRVAIRHYQTPARVRVAIRHYKTPASTLVTTFNLLIFSNYYLCRRVIVGVFFIVSMLHSVRLNS